MIGIYCYEDTFKDNEIVYIGKDAYIHKDKRHREHLWKSRYHKQPINRILQKNPGRYRYRILKQWDGSKYNKNLANALEMIYIHRYRPKFNFTIGGDGSRGYEYTDEQRKKLSEIHKGQIPWNKGIPNCFNHTDEAKKKIRKAQTGETNSMYGKTPWNKGKTGKDSHLYNHDYRLVKNGSYTRADGTIIQKYCIKGDGKVLKRNNDKDYLIKWFKETYPNNELKGDLI